MFVRLIAASTVAAYCVAVASSGVCAFEQVTIERNSETTHVAGELVVEAEDGGLLLLAEDGTLWALQPEEITARASNNLPLEPLDAERLAAHVLAELPPGFDVHQTAHYLIIYNTSTPYAQWVGALYERLYRGFYNYWSRRGHELSELESPLVALVFDTRESYLRYSQPELGDAAGAIIGYYSLASNRTVSYDLTGVEGVGGAGARISSASHVNRLLAQPAAEALVATIIHEATHQLAYNCGLQTRYADNPLWLSEGLAIFFETPDLSSRSGWRSIGAVNSPRLARFQRNIAGRPANSIETLIADESRFRDAGTVLDSYAEAWALVFFLNRRYPDEFDAYLTALSAKQPLRYDEPAERLALFQEHFGEDLAALDTEFIRQMSRLRP